MRVPALLLLVALLPAAASSQEWCDAPICAQFEGTNQVRIRVPEQLELTFTKEEGFGDEVYDLAADPDKLHDLAAADPEVNGIFWTKIAEVGEPVSYCANNAAQLELLEANGVRVRARSSGQHHRYGIVGQPWDDLGYTQTFTVYATGEVFVDYALIATRDIELQGFAMIVKSTGTWGPFGPPGNGANEAECVGEHGLAIPNYYLGTSSPFAMVSSDGSHYFADILMGMYANEHSGSYWNEGFQDSDFRCGLAIFDFHPELLEGTSHLLTMMRIAQDMNDPASASKYVDAYRDPDDDLEVTQGTQVLDDPGDFDGDGFNESEGAYVLRREEGQDIELLLHAAIPRMNPVFKILDWNEPAPLNLWIDDVSYAEGTQFRASVTDDTLIVQLLGERNADTEVRVAGAVEVPALPWLGGVLLAAGLGAIGARRIKQRPLPS